MSAESRLRRIGNLERRIAYENRKALDCEGLSLGLCTYTLPDREPPFNRVTSTDMCYNHSKTTEFRYRNLIRKLEAVKERHKRI